MELIIFGASSMGVNVYEKIKRYYKIVYFCDNDSIKWGKNINGIQCISPKELYQFLDYTIIIASSFKNEIKTQLESMNITKYYFCEEFLDKMCLNKYINRVGTESFQINLKFDGNKKSYKFIEKTKPVVKLNLNNAKSCNFITKKHHTKISVIDHIGNRGGGSRFIRSLLPAIKKIEKNFDIEYYGNYMSTMRENLFDEFSKVDIKVNRLKSLDIKGNNFDIDLSLQKEIERIGKKSDLVFLPWPFLMNCPNMDCPIVGVFHDFNFKYFFGQKIFNDSTISFLNREVPKLINKSIPVVSTNFMANELKKFYPQFSNKVKVVHLAPFSETTIISKDESEKIISKMGINYKYIIYPTNLCYHKNINSLLAAFYLLKKRGFDIKLILTGEGTQNIIGKIGLYGIELSTTNPDVIGVGYVTNKQIDALIQCAEAVVTTSIYEAGNGPGIDGWYRGVPVAMSNIPAFIEHIEVFGVRAQMFNPKNSSDIADKIQNILMNKELALEDAKISQASIKNLTWDNVAEKYIKIFMDTIK